MEIKCKIDDCKYLTFRNGKPYICKGYCNRHYISFSKYGDALASEKRISLRPTKCSVNECNGKGTYYKNRNKRYLSLGLCSKHYTRLKEGKDLNANSIRDSRPAIIEGDIAKIPLGLNAKDGYAIVDKEFAYLADEYRWHCGSGGYAINRRVSFLHHLIIGVPKKGYVVDHINRNRLDNRLVNLRIVKEVYNLINRRGNHNARVKYKGVSMHKTKTGYSYIAQITSGRVNKYIGSFKTAEEAAVAYDEKAENMWGEYAYLNFPKGDIL